MLTPHTGRVRLARAAVVCGMVLSMSLGAHLLGGGTAPSPLLLGAMAAFLLLLCVLLAERRFTPARLLAVLGAGQLVLHTLFEWLGSATCVVTGSGPALDPHAGHLSVAPVTLSGCVSAAQDHAGHLGAAASSGMAMVLAHAAATVLVAGLIARGERALWDAARVLVTLAGRLLVGPALLVVDEVRPLPATRYGRTDRLHARGQAHVAPRRGPPGEVWALAV